MAVNLTDREKKAAGELYNILLEEAKQRQPNVKFSNVGKFRPNATHCVASNVLFEVQLDTSGDIGATVGSKEVTYKLMMVRKSDGTVVAKCSVNPLDNDGGVKAFESLQADYSKEHGQPFMDSAIPPY